MTLRRVEARGAKETAHTLRQTAGQVFRYGIATGRCERNPALDLQGALKPIHVMHMAAVLEPDKAGDLTLGVALRRMGYSNEDMTPHGFRAMARTIMVERLDVMPDVIEAQLAHAKSGSLGSAYDRAEFMAQRQAMMKRWADYLDALREEDKADV